MDIYLIRSSFLAILFFVTGFMYLSAQTIPKPKPSNQDSKRKNYSRDAASQGDFIINLGAGFPSVLYRSRNLTQEIPALSGSFEYMINDNMGIGVYAGYLSAKSSMPVYTYRIIVGGPRLAYRLFVNEKFDVYGSMVGLVTYAQAKDNNGVVPPDGKLYDFGFASYLGGRYMLTENLGVFAELGWGVALFNGGATLRF